MDSPLHVVETTFICAKHLKNVNRGHGNLLPYAVVWADPSCKCSTLADPIGGSSPRWNQTLPVLLPQGTAVEDAVLHFELVHAGSEHDTNPLIGQAELQLHDAFKDYSSGGRVNRQTIQLKRPSGRPQGTVDVELVVKEMCHRVPPTANVAPPPPASREYTAPPPSSGQEEDTGGMSTGFVLGAAAVTAGLLTGLALTKGLDYVVDKIADLAEDFKEFLPSDDDDSEATEDHNSEDASETSSEDEDEEEDPIVIDLSYEDDDDDSNQSVPIIH